MIGHGQKLTRKQEATVAALLVEPTHAKAAAKAGISEATLHRWLQLPEFTAAYRQARARVVEDAVAQLQRATAAAVRTLRRNMRCGKPAAEIRAAVAILDQAIRGAVVADHEARLQAIEERQKRS